MIQKIFSLLKKKKDPKGNPRASKQEGSKSPAVPYSEEEAQKVKERLQGLGYID